MKEPDFELPFDRLPERFVESVTHPDSDPVDAKAAATVVLVREGAAGMEVLLLRRSQQSGFVPGAYVFPGGRLDPSDGNPELAERIDGLTPRDAARRLGLDDGHEAIAYYVAALREAFEETGILVGRRTGGEAPPTAAEDAGVEALRVDLLEHRRSFADVLDAMRCHLDGGGVVYVAHWITPESEPRRYDTRFFVARVTRGARTVLHLHEMIDRVWLTPPGALERNRAGTLPMVFPTIRTLERLADFSGVDEALRELERQDVPTLQPRLVITPRGVAITLPADGEPRSEP